MADISELSDMLNRYQRKVASNEGKINRLKLVYNELGAIKSSFHAIKRKTEDVFHESDNWQGDRYKEFSKAGELLDETLNAYYKQLDAAQDAVNTKRAELRAENQRLIPIIGSIAAQITELLCNIQNDLN